MEAIQTRYRTHTCGQLREADVDRTIRLAGWVHSYRDYGNNLVFIDLRDRDGITQLVFDPADCGKAAHDESRRLRSEWVISITGTVKARAADAINNKLPTGHIEVRVTALDVLSVSPTPPFTPAEHETVNEEKRLQYRFIDLRRQEMQQTLRTRYPGHPPDAAIPGRPRILGNRNAVSHPIHARRGPRFYRPVALCAGEFLRAAAVAAVVQAIADGRGLRQIHADRPLLPRRGPARRSAGRIHAARHGDGVHRPRKYHRHHRGTCSG